MNKDTFKLLIRGRFYGTTSCFFPASIVWRAAWSWQAKIFL